MKRTITRNVATTPVRARLRYVSLPALMAMPLALVTSCSIESETSPASEGTSSVSQACHDGPTLTASPGSCGYHIATEADHRWRRAGYRGEIELTNVSGDRAGSFEILTDLGGGAMAHVRDAEIEQTIDGAFLLESPRSLEHHKIRRNETYEIEYQSPDPPNVMRSYVISINGVRCDTTPPAISLTADGGFYTSAGNLTLTATASDDVAVRKVVFLQDGVQIGVDTTAPYELVVPMSGTLNGRRRFTAVAYDPSGNSTTSNLRSVLVAIGSKFFGTEVDVALDYTHFTDYFNQLTPGNAGKWGVVQPVKPGDTTCSGYVALTFDDGPGTNTTTLLNVLKTAGARATLFNLGQNAASNPSLVQAEVAAGMWVNNHSYTHSHMTGLSQSDMLSELTRTNEVLTANGASPKIFRPPYGETNATLQAAATAAGLKLVTWDVDAQDWNGASTDAIVAAAGSLTNGQIILMHDTYQTTNAAIPQIVNNLKAKGLCPGMIDPSTGRAVAPPEDSSGSGASTGGQMDWSKLDTAYQYAKQHNARFKFHTLVWGQQQPTWVATLPPDQQLAALDQWMTQVAARYPDLDMIDVVNEPLHAPPSYAAALGGAGATGWDWVIKAFEMARAHFPKSELLLNDYNVLFMTSATNDYLKIVNLLKDRGLIDGIGEQGHFLEKADLSVVSANLASLAATGLPIYVSELDINFANDARQAQRMSQLFPIFWSNPSVVGVTHWGYVQSAMWQKDSYLLRTDGTQRPALDWLVCYRAGGTNCPLPEYVPQPRTGDMNGVTLEAEDYDDAQGLMSAGSMVAYANNGSWLEFYKLVFHDNWDALNVSYAHANPSAINLTVHLGSLSNAPVATIPLPPTGDWTTMKTVAIPWAPMSGMQDVFVRFNGGGANIDKFQFAAPAGTGKNLIADSDFELGTKDGWWSWSPGTIANTTARAVSGTHALVMTGRTGNSPLVESLTSAVVPGKTYKVSLWASIGGASASASVTTALQCTGGTTTYGRLGGWGNAKTLTDGTWVEFAGDLQVPDCPLANVAIWLEGPTAGDLYIDHASVRPYTTANIVPNGTFESGASGWYTWGGAAVSATNARAHSGSQSLLVSNRTGNSPATTDLTSLVKPGTNYPFSLWVSIHTADGSSKAINVTQAASCKAADGTVSTAYNWIGGPATIADGNIWTQLSGTVAVPNCNLTQLLFWVENGVPADIYVDDVQIMASGSASTNLITDGTFESGQGAWGGWGQTSLSVVSTAAHSGTRSILGAGMQQYGAIARDIKALVAPGKKYQATGWVSVGSLAAGSGPVKWQTIQNCNGDTQDSYPWLAGATVANGAWTQVSGVVDLTACTTINKLMLFAGADSGDLLLDDVSLTPLP